MSNPNIVLSGRIATDIETKQMTDGTQKAKFRIITSDRKKSDSGEWEDVNVSGWTVVAWDKLAIRVIEHLSKGMPITVQGSIKEVSWVDQSGNKKRSTEVRASEVAININSFKKEVSDVMEMDEETIW